MSEEELDAEPARHQVIIEDSDKAAEEQARPC
jgi:hypothetical protein